MVISVSLTLYTRPDGCAPTRTALSSLSCYFLSRKFRWGQWPRHPECCWLLPALRREHEDQKGEWRTWRGWCQKATREHARGPWITPLGRSRGGAKRAKQDITKELVRNPEPSASWGLSKCHDFPTLWGSGGLPHLLPRYPGSLPSLKGRWHFLLLSPDLFPCNVASHTENLCRMTGGGGTARKRGFSFPSCEVGIIVMD